MDQAIQKQTSAALIFARQPQQFLTQLEELLVTLQDAYRSKLSAAEQQLWVTTLTMGEEGFSMQEVHAAVTEMIKNPPLFEVPGPNGPVTQKWRGMPKLPDLIETMLDLRSRRVGEARREAEQKRQEEWREMEQRRQEHPEEFFGWADVVKFLKEQGLPRTKNSQRHAQIEAGYGAIPTAMCMPEVHMQPTGETDRYGLAEMVEVSPILSNDQVAEQRRQELKRQFEEHQGKQESK